MDINAIREFNAQKAVIVAAMFPATISFSTATTFECAFGEVEDNSALHQSGLGYEHIKVGSLHWPVTAGVSPEVGQTFKITACAHDPSLVGTKWHINSREVASHEYMQHFVCTRLNE